MLKLERMAVNRFRRTREAHALETAQDYVEMVEALIREFGEARAVDLAERLGVSPVTVSKTVCRLCRDGYLTKVPYRSVFLTPKGAALAEESRKRHEVVLRFLLALGVPPEVAEEDAEGIEHHVSADTLLAMDRFVQKSKGR